MEELPNTYICDMFDKQMKNVFTSFGCMYKRWFRRNSIFCSCAMVLSIQHNKLPTLPCGFSCNRACDVDATQYKCSIILYRGTCWNSNIIRAVTVTSHQLKKHYTNIDDYRYIEYFIFVLGFKLCNFCVLFEHIIR